MPRNVPEWRGATPNTAIPQRVKLRIFERDSGRCQMCTRQCGGSHEPFAFDHKVALVNGGEHRENNIQLLCEHCHAGKTAADVAEKSAVYRKRSKALGLKPKSRHPLPGGRHDKFKRTVDGRTVLR